MPEWWVDGVTEMQTRGTDKEKRIRRWSIAGVIGAIPVVLALLQFMGFSTLGQLKAAFSGTASSTPTPTVVSVASPTYQATSAPATSAPAVTQSTFSAAASFTAAPAAPAGCVQALNNINLWVKIAQTDQEDGEVLAEANAYKDLSSVLYTDANQATETVVRADINEAALDSYAVGSDLAADNSTALRDAAGQLQTSAISLNTACAT